MALATSLDPLKHDSNPGQQGTNDDRREDVDRFSHVMDYARRIGRAVSGMCQRQSRGNEQTNQTEHQPTHENIPFRFRATTT